MEKPTTKSITKTALKKMNVANIVEHIINSTRNCKEFIPAAAQNAAGELASRFGITPMQAVLLAVFIDMYDDNRILHRDIAKHFGLRPINVIGNIDDINYLVSEGFIAKRRGCEGELSYSIDFAVVEGLLAGKRPKKESLENLEATAFIDAISKGLNARIANSMSDEELELYLTTLIESNQHLVMAQKLKGYNFIYSDLVLFLAISSLFINNHDDNVQRHDIDDLFDLYVLRHLCRELENGTHVLMKARLVEHSCCDGKVENFSWKLTDYAKNEVYAELNLKPSVKIRTNMTHYEDITAKELFYNPNVTTQVDQLSSILNCTRMQAIMNRLADKGMRRGFTCLFYGTPGTGKTETALQLARLTQRDIMLVDVPSIRSKWVGETEKNIQAVFTRYKKVAKDNNQAPILLFNEADALLNCRNVESSSSVDKMENAMQNIILQEMENFEGVMIATTNLTGNLDPAFERRFLYKIEFEKPSAKERASIWKSMLTELTDEQALNLAQQFDFSGGQIENIARKRIINDILNERDSLDYNSVIDSCKNEQLNHTSNHIHVGF